MYCMYIFQIMQGNLDKCSVDSIKKTIKITNEEHLTIFVNKICAVETKMIQNLVKELLMEVDLGKYVTMVCFLINCF